MFDAINFDKEKFKIYAVVIANLTKEVYPSLGNIIKTKSFLERIEERNSFVFRTKKYILLKKEDVERRDLLS